MACAPFLCLDFLVHGQAGPNEHFEHTSLSGFFCLIFMTGWMCSTIVLKRTLAAGTRPFGVFIVNAQLFTLSLANIWNVWEIVAPGSSSALYFVLDFFWPLSQAVLIAIGVTVVAAGRVSGWGRWVPLLAGLWFPLSVLLMGVSGPTFQTMVVSGVYSAVMWFLLGLMCYGVDLGGYVRRWMSVQAVL